MGCYLEFVAIERFRSGSHGGWLVVGMLYGRIYYTRGSVSRGVPGSGNLGLYVWGKIYGGQKPVNREAYLELNK